MKINHLIAIAFCISFLFACNNKDIDSLLKQSEAIMFNNPEGALGILKTIDEKEISTAKQKAHYSLTYSYALYKNYINPKDDTKIKIAYKYYIQDGNGTSKEKMLSSLLIGSLQRQEEKTDEAMLSFQRALEYGKETNEYFLMGQIYANMAALCSHLHDSDDLIYSKQAQIYYLKARAELYALDAELQYANSLYNKKKYKECREIIDSVKAKAIEYNDTMLLIASNRLQASIEIVSNNEEKAKENLNNIYKLKAKLTINDYCQLATIYAHEEKIDSALYYINKAKPTGKKNYDWINYYNITSIIYKNIGEYDEALKNFALMSQIKDSIYTSHLAKSVAKVQRDYILQEMELQRIKGQKQNSYWLTLSVLLCSLLLFTFIQTKRNITKKEQKMEKVLSLLDEGKKSIRNQQKEINKLEKRNTILFEQKLTTLDGLLTSYFNGKNTYNQKNAIYKQVQSIIKGFCNDDKSFYEIENLINQKYDNILDRIKLDFPTIKEIDYKYFCFTFAGFSSRSISLLLDESIENIYQKRSRWKSRIEMIDSQNKNLYLSIMA